MNTKEYCTWKWVTTDFGANWRPSIKYDTPILNIISAIFFIHLVGINLTTTTPVLTLPCHFFAYMSKSPHHLLLRISRDLTSLAGQYPSHCHTYCCENCNYFCPKPPHLIPLLWMCDVITLWITPGYLEFFLRLPMFPIAFLHDFPNWGTLL